MKRVGLVIGGEQSSIPVRRVGCAEVGERTWTLEGVLFFGPACLVNAMD